MDLLIWIAVIALLVLIYSFVNLILPSNVKDLRGIHVVVTGGSSGIGKSVAVLCAGKGANVTIIARNKEKLDEARTEVVAAAVNPKSQRIRAVPLDVTQSFAEIDKAITDIEKNVGPISIFVNCAGSAQCATVKDATEDNFRSMINLNLMGTILPTKSVVQKMMERQEGTVVITASLGAILGIYGMSAYCASKWALRGFAESLHQEVAPYKISVTLALPPDTDTPGFEAENRDKPEETKMICQSGGLYSPDKVAEKLLADALKGRFYSTVGLEGALLSLGASGFSPFSSIGDLFVQISLAGLLRIISIFHLRNVTSIVSSLHSSKSKTN